MSRRVWKLQDFIAHPGRALCARLGEQSGQVLATGGDDRRVNVWKVGKPNAMMSLTGHTTAPECLVFDKQEEILIVGCAGGAIQVWNLEYRRMNGTLSGHRTACSAVEVHPYGEFFASGSADTNLKIWDLRRKSQIQTYKGHTGSITSIRFSPHGRWVVTGGQDNQVKLWDLTAGKLMRDLDLHQGPITSIAFHPKEYLLATGSADRTTTIWSLESFRALCTSDLGSSPIQAVKFYPEEQSLFAASHDVLRLYPVDDLSQPTDSMDVDWRGLQDTRLCLPEEKLLAISLEGSQLGIWVADLQKREGSARGLGSGVGRAPARQPSLVGQSRRPGSAQRRPMSPQEANGEPQGNELRSLLQRPSAQAHERTLAPGVATPSRGEAPAQPGTPARRGAEPSNGHWPGIEGKMSSPSRAAPSASPKGALTGEERAPQHAGGEMDVGRLAQQFGSEHPQMMGVLQRRLEHVRRLKELWGRGNIAGIHSVLIMPQDQAVFCDFARAIMQQKLDSVLNLDACLTLLPILRDLLDSKYESFAETAVQFGEVLLQRFGELIAGTRSSCSKIPERELDLSREERLRKCNACYDLFRELHSALPAGRTGGRFDEFGASLQAFLQRC